MLKQIGCCIVGVVSYTLLFLAVYEDSRWAAVVVLLSDVILLLGIRKDRFNLLHVMCISTIIYSILILINVNGEVIMQSNNPILIKILFMVSKIFASYSVSVVLMFSGLILVVISLTVNQIVGAARKNIADKVHGTLPHVERVGRRRKCAYLSYKTEKVNIIYRNGSRVQILDSFDYNFLNSEEQYSLELIGEHELFVRSYNIYTHKMIMEKSYKI